jgi:hypothetical protein
MSGEFSLPFRYLKNPFALYLDFMVKTTGNRKQGVHGEAIDLEAGQFSKILQQDYIDIRSEEFERYIPSLRKINERLSSALETKIDIQTDQRSIVEKKIDYRYPLSNHEKFTDTTLGVFRGIWQVFEPSNQKKDRLAGNSTIRASYFLFYGFRSDLKKRNHIDLLWIGRTTMWRATAGAEGHDILYIDAKECGHSERKFFTFYVPGLHDRLHNSEIVQLKGIAAGTVMDRAYQRHYPAIANLCVARKLTSWSNWFANNDAIIGEEFLANLKQQLKGCIGCGYYPLAELLRKSQKELAGDTEDEDRNKEITLHLDSLLENLCNSKEALVPSLIVGQSI